MPEGDLCRVMIFDDEPEKAQAWREQIEGLKVAGVEVASLSKIDIQGHLDALYGRRTEADEGKSVGDFPSALDDVDILIVDFDLRHLDDHRGFATGEEIAYAARLFSRVKIIVVVNHPNIGLNNFDLTLQRDRELRGDVYVGHKQVGNPGLWLTDPGYDGFLPWSWSVLIEDVCTFRKCAEEVAANFEKPILSYFGLDQPETSPSPDMLTYLGIKRDEDVVMSQLLNSTNFVRPQDLKTLVKDQSRHVHVTTALLRKWFRRWLLPPQTLLADLPHLALTLPWGVLGYQDVEVWNRIAVCGRSSRPCDLARLLHPEIVGTEFAHGGWTGRPAFVVRRARAALEAQEAVLSNFQLEQMPSLAFAEDLSRFIPEDRALTYSVALDGQPQTRHVSSPDDVEIKDKRFGLSEIIYSPQSLIL